MMSKDEPLLQTKKCQLETADPRRNYARVRGYKKKGQEKDKKRKEKSTASKSIRARTSLQDYFYAKITPTR